MIDTIEYRQALNTLPGLVMNFFLHQNEVYGAIEGSDLPRKDWQNDPEPRTFTRWFVYLFAASSAKEQPYLDIRAWYMGDSETMNLAIIDIHHLLFKAGYLPPLTRIQRQQWALNSLPGLQVKFYNHHRDTQEDGAPYDDDYISWHAYMWTITCGGESMEYCGMGYAENQEEAIHGIYSALVKHRFLFPDTSTTQH